jgi:hypothetical protein
MTFSVMAHDRVMSIAQKESFRVSVA